MACSTTKHRLKNSRDDNLQVDTPTYIFREVTDRLITDVGMSTNLVFITAILLCVL